MIAVHNLGLTDYHLACELQRETLRWVADGEAPETLLLLEHPPTVTVGKAGRLENILVPADELKSRGISLYFTERGGDVTYHAPGQLVAYPILDLRKRNRDARGYVRDLEEATLRTLADFAIEGRRDESHAGIWVDGREIAAIGISLRRWTTFHGVALNINIDPQEFALINPCGFKDRQAVSMKSLLGRQIDMAEVERRFVLHFSEVFETGFETGGAYADQASALVQAEAA